MFGIPNAPLGFHVAPMDCLMENATGGAVTKGDVVALKGVDAAADAIGTTFKRVKLPVDAVNDNIDENELGIFGVALEDCANDATAQFRVRFQGVVEAKIEGTPDKGAALGVSLDTTGKLKAVALNDKVFAFYIGIDSTGAYEAAADDEVVRVLFDGINGFGMDNAT